MLKYACFPIVQNYFISKTNFISLYKYYSYTNIQCLNTEVSGRRELHRHQGLHSTDARRSEEPLDLHRVLAGPKIGHKRQRQLNLHPPLVRRVQRPASNGPAAPQLQRQSGHDTQAAFVRRRLRLREALDPRQLHSHAPQSSARLHCLLSVSAYAPSTRIQRERKRNFRAAAAAAAAAAARTTTNNNGRHLLYEPEVISSSIRANTARQQSSRPLDSSQLAHSESECLQTHVLLGDKAYALAAESQGEHDQPWWASSSSWTRLGGIR